MIQPKNEAEDFLLSFTKDCKTLKELSHTKAQETLEFKLTQPRQTFSIQPPILIEELGSLN